MNSYIQTTDAQLIAKLRRSNALNIVANVASVVAIAGFAALVYIAWHAGPRWQVITATAVFVGFTVLGGWAFETCARWMSEVHMAADQAANSTDVHSPVDATA